jgi:hypothetical protein
MRRWHSWYSNVTIKSIAYNSLSTGGILPPPPSSSSKYKCPSVSDKFWLNTLLGKERRLGERDWLNTMYCMIVAQLCKTHLLWQSGEIYLTWTRFYFTCPNLMSWSLFATISAMFSRGVITHSCPYFHTFTTRGTAWRRCPVAVDTIDLNKNVE